MEQLLTLKAVAAILGTSEVNVSRLIDRGVLPAVNVAATKRPRSVRGLDQGISPSPGVRAGRQGHGSHMAANAHRPSGGRGLGIPHSSRPLQDRLLSVRQELIQRSLSHAPFSPDASEGDVDRREFPGCHETPRVTSATVEDCGHLLERQKTFSIHKSTRSQH